MAFQLIISAFSNGARIPTLHTCDGAGLSPAVEWSGEPPTTQSFALVVDDPDAPGGVWNHWLLYDIPAAVHTLPQGARPGQIGRSGANDFGRPGYNGPCPPRGHGSHRYYFRLFALDVPALTIPGGAKRADLDSALRGHVVAEATSMGRYERAK
ncbi:MAG: YbhB/YbcL family Raf kinase inhibitor-like protein [Bryobacteraceae bacterium]